MAMMVFRNCQTIEGGLPNTVKAKMLLNIVVDFGIGIVPFLGDILDAIFRANTRNAALLEQYLREKGAKAFGDQHHHLPSADSETSDRQEREDSPPPGYTIAVPASSDKQKK